jgi:hypothetical protein
MSAICEISFNEAGIMPELSYGSHFFQDLVETGIFYAAIYNGNRDVIFNSDKILNKKNIFTSLFPDNKQLSNVIFIAETTGMELFSDIVTETLICR